MHFYVSMNRFGLMSVLMSSNLYTTEDMSMTYLFCFVHLIILRNSKIIKQRNIRFTCEKEHNNSVPFLDVLITRTRNGFKTSMYQKPLFSGVYSNFNSFISYEYKVGFIFALLIRMFRIFQDFIGLCQLKGIS